MVDIKSLKDKVMRGEQITAEEALSFDNLEESQQEELWAAAHEITRKFCPRVFDSCSILNARSGKCPENCKWCAQSAHYKTSVSTYPLISREECMRVADHNRLQGIRRFSLVTSGRAMKGEALDTACSYYRELRDKGGMHLCASMGLLNREEALRLRRNPLSLQPGGCPLIFLHALHHPHR
jgi:biotin synthase-like enzyme